MSQGRLSQDTASGDRLEWAQSPELAQNRPWSIPVRLPHVSQEGVW